MPYPSEGIESTYKTNHIDDVKVRSITVLFNFYIRYFAGVLGGSSPGREVFDFERVREAIGDNVPASDENHRRVLAEFVQSASASAALYDSQKRLRTFGEGR
jgi:hypothetical protein